MKQFLFTIGLITLTILPKISGSINYRNKQLVLISFNLTIHEQVKEKLDGYVSSFPDIKNPKGDRIIGRIMEYTWFLLEERLGKETGMYILPLDTYGKQFDYDEYGYPNTSINKALHRGTSKYYMRIDMSIEPEILQSYSKSSVLRTKKDTSTLPADSTQIQGFKPKVTISLSSYSDKGIIPIEKLIGTFLAPEPWLFEPKVLDGLVNGNNRGEYDNLCALINEAITDLIKVVPSY